MDPIRRAFARPPVSAYVFVLLRLAVFVLGLESVLAEQPTLSQIEAAFLLNFTKFVEWPNTDALAQGPLFTICLLGDDPFGPVLDQMIEGETVNGRRLVVRRIRSETPGCSILYVSSHEKNLHDILAGAGPGVLTVGEGDDFLNAGGMIAFALENRRVRFDIDREAAQKAGLKLSSRLLGVARSVR